MFGFDDTGDAQVDLGKILNAYGVGNWLDDMLLMLGVALFGMGFRLNGGLNTGFVGFH